MGRWLSKKQYRERAILIVKLRDVDKLQFSDIAKRVNAHPSSVERSYHQFKEEKHG